MLAAFKKVAAWFQLVPLIIGLMRAVEESIPGVGRGEARLAAVRAGLELAYHEIENILGDFPAVWDRIVKLIKLMVDKFNNDENDKLFVKPPTG